MRNLALLIVAAIGLALIPLGCNEPHKTTRLGIVKVDAAKGQRLVSERSGLLRLGQPMGVWLDPRSHEEFKRGRIAGAVNVPLEEIRGRMERLGGVSTIIVYGQDESDTRAEAAARKLIEIGFTRTRLLEGGLQAWTAAGHELESGSLAP